MAEIIYCLNENNLLEIKHTLLQDSGNKESRECGFIIDLTYHLFVTETRVHPAAILHTLLAFDLHVTDTEKWSLKDVMNKLPFINKGSVAVSRNIQIEFGRDKNLQTTPYYFDGGPEKTDYDCPRHSSEYSNNELKLWNDWLESKGFPKITQELSAAQPVQAQAQDAVPVESESLETLQIHDGHVIKIKEELYELFKTYFGFDKCLVH